jgi:tRNA(Ile)-lysidine synthase
MRKVNILRRVEKALGEAGVAQGHRLLAAVSGGVDSMVLLDALVCLRERLGIRVHVAHIHHGLRGRAADGDAAFVTAEAARRGLGASMARLHPDERRPGESVQVWARAARYRHLDAIAERMGATFIAVAHTQDDQAETVLLNLLRGTGPRGLAGIPPTRRRILRPLLQVSRAEVEAYASSRQVEFRTDASNTSDAYRRNRVRHHLLPLLAKEYNLRIVESLASLAGLMREDEDALASLADRLLAESSRVVDRAVILDVAPLAAAPPSVVRRTFHGAFQQASQAAHSLTRRHLDALRVLLSGGGAVRLPGGFVGQRVGRQIRIGRSAAEPPTSGTVLPAMMPIRPGVWTAWPPLACRIRVRRLVSGRAPLADPTHWQASLSPQVLLKPLSLRARRPGDRFRPLGMQGQKKLQDFFVDAKVPREDREHIPLLMAGNRIASVIGYRIAQDFRWRGRGAACLLEVEFAGRQASAAMKNSKPTMQN